MMEDIDTAKAQGRKRREREGRWKWPCWRLATGYV